MHPWDLSPREAIALQRQLASRVLIKPLPEHINLAAGADVGYCRRDNMAVAVVAVYTFPALELRTQVYCQAVATFPYVPGLLSFREIPMLIEVFQRLPEKPDVVLCDGQGVAHPRRIGLASHLGLWLNVPTIGCAKTRLEGKHGNVGAGRGNYRSLIHQGERVGVALRTRANIKPLYVSPGYLADVDSSRRLVADCCLQTRIPEPIRRAHLTAQQVIRNLNRRVPARPLTTAREDYQKSRWT